MNYKKKHLFLAILLVLNLFISFNFLLILAYGYEVDDTGTVTYIVDGDTVDVSSVGRIRLADINTPEEGQPGYDEATNYISSLIYQKTVYVDIDDIYGTDVYGRIVAVLYVYYDASHVKNVNKAMVDSGLAVIWNFDNEFNPYTWNLIEPYPPNNNPPPYDPPPYTPPPEDPTPSNPNNTDSLLPVTAAIGVLLGGSLGIGAIAYFLIIPEKYKTKRIKFHRSKYKDNNSLQKIIEKQSFPGTSSTIISPNTKLIKDIISGNNNINITGEVVKIRQPHEFIKKDGSKGKVGSFIMKDDTGSIRVVVWDDRTHIFTESSFCVGKKIILENVYSKLNTFKGLSKIEIHVGKFSRLSSPRN
ncbi:MAG: thermonuclease family protein [Promethearchaeota archaeon]